MSLEELVLRHAMGQQVEALQREKQAAGVMMIPVPKAGILGEVRGKTAAHCVDGNCGGQHYNSDWWRGGPAAGGGTVSRFHFRSC